MRILVITDQAPWPPISGATLRVYNLFKRVSMEHKIWLACLDYDSYEVEGQETMLKFCSGIEIVKMRRRHPIMHLPGLLRYLIAGKPLECKFHYSKELAYRIHHLASVIDFDIVQIEHSVMALYLEALPPKMHCKSILSMHNITFDQYSRISRIEKKLGKKMRTFLNSLIMRRWEPYYAERFSHCITVSEADRRLLISANECLNVGVVPNGVDTQSYQPLPINSESPTLIFVGKMSYEPCADAVTHFCHDILPLIRSAIRNVYFLIVGQDPPPEVVRLRGNGVHVTGRVDDLIPYYRRSTASVVPLRAGGGTRLKILEAMALGRPVVSTSIGCEGIDVVDGEHLFIADSPKQFAEKTVRLLQDKELSEKIRNNARHLVVTQYDWDIIAKNLLQIYSLIT